MARTRARATARARARARAEISDVRNIYRTSDIYWTSDTDLGNIGVILS